MARPEVTGRVTSSGSRGKLHIDRRAHRLVDVDFHPEERLTTKEVAAWLYVSVQFLEIGERVAMGPNSSGSRTSSFDTGSVMCLSGLNRARTLAHPNTRRGRGEPCPSKSNRPRRCTARPA